MLQILEIHQLYFNQSVDQGSCSLACKDVTSSEHINTMVITVYEHQSLRTETSSMLSKSRVRQNHHT